jgi:hypothetical protein
MNKLYIDIKELHCPYLSENEDNQRTYLLQPLITNLGNIYYKTLVKRLSKKLLSKGFQII